MPISHLPIRNPPADDPQDDASRPKIHPPPIRLPPSPRSRRIPPNPRIPLNRPIRLEPPPSAVNDLNLGSPNATYKFDNKGTFFTYKASDSEVAIKNGKLEFTIFDAIDWSLWSFSSLELKNYYFEINMTMPADCVDKDRGGITFGTPPGDTDKGIISRSPVMDTIGFTFTTGTPPSTFLIHWTEHDAINEGPNSTNRLGVLHVGNKSPCTLTGKLWIP